MQCGRNYMAVTGRCAHHCEGQGGYKKLHG